MKHTTAVFHSFLLIGFLGAWGCQSSDDSGRPGGPSATGGASGASTGDGSGGRAAGSGGNSAAGSGKSGGATGAGGSGGQSATSGSGGRSSMTSGTGGKSGTSSGSGGASSGAGGTSSSSSSGTGGGTHVDYAWAPPSQCHNQDYISYEAGCKDGDTSSTCGGKCTTINACLEDSTTKPHADLTFLCPRFMLFSDEMLQAATDDGNSDFNYAIVGHDVDKGGIDGTDDTTCCQCYQLVYAYPSPNNERQVLSDPDHPNPPTSAIPLPKPLIAQSFNTAATSRTFDVYMAAGGFGANNACAPGQSPAAKSGKYMYTAYPTDGQPSQGGVKPVSLYSECKTQIQWVTTESISSDACQSKVETACNTLQSDIPGLTEESRRSCLESNNPDHVYHMNWAVYAAKVECPQHLTEVTGCKLAPQGLPAVKKDVITADQAAADADFWKKTSSDSGLYETTTMEDCCRPSCASTNWISQKGLKTQGDYNAFYVCDEKGTPYLEEQ